MSCRILDKKPGVSGLVSWKAGQICHNDRDRITTGYYLKFIYESDLKRL